MSVGDPDGFGRYGVMERGEYSALCHECGAWVASVRAACRLLRSAVRWAAPAPG